MVLTLISLGIFLLYILYTIIKFNIPTSISESYYLYNKKFYFTIVMFLSAFLLAPELLESSKNNLEFISFFIIGSMLFIGASPSFKEGLDKKVHLISAILAGISSLIYITIFDFYLTINAIILSIVIYFLDKKRILFWIELIIGIFLYITVILNLI